jgi:hypothetical protein
LALHEASHAVGHYRQGVSVRSLFMAERNPRLPTRFTAGVDIADPTTTGIVGALAGPVANALCGANNDLSISNDISQVMLAALIAAGANVQVHLTGDGCIACDFSRAGSIDRNAVVARIQEAWRETIMLVTDPQNFGAIHAVASEALKRSSLDAAAIKQAIESSRPYAPAALTKRRDFVLAQTPAIWEAEVEQQIVNRFGQLEWR